MNEMRKRLVLLYFLFCSCRLSYGHVRQDMEKKLARWYWQWMVFVCCIYVFFCNMEMKVRCFLQKKFQSSYRAFPSFSFQNSVCGLVFMRVHVCLWVGGKTKKCVTDLANLGFVDRKTFYEFLMNFFSISQKNHLSCLILDGWEITLIFLEASRIN